MEASKRDRSCSGRLQSPSRSEAFDDGSSKQNKGATLRGYVEGFVAREVAREVARDARHGFV